MHVFFFTAQTDLTVSVLFLPSASISNSHSTDGIVVVLLIVIHVNRQSIFYEI